MLVAWCDPQIITSLFSLPAIQPLELSSLLLLACYCKLARDDYALLEQVITFAFSKIDEKPLQQAVATLFLSVCKDCGVSIKQNPAFIGGCSVTGSRRRETPPARHDDSPRHG